MPDGDIVHEHLERRYHTSYKQLCEGKLTGEELANGVVEAVWKDMKQGKDTLIAMLKGVAIQLQGILDRKFFEDIDWQQEGALIDAKTHVYANKPLRDLAVKACKEEFWAIRNGVRPTNCFIELLTGYMTNVYDAKFVERVPLAPTHHNDASEAFVGEQLEMMRPFVKARLQEYVKAIYEKETVYLPRQPRRKHVKVNYSVDSDIPTLGA